MDTQKIISDFKDEGFPFVYEWEDAPNTIYEKHFHKGQTALYTIDGEIEFHFLDTNKKVLLKKGEKIYVEPNRPHTAKVGKHGWKVIVAEMIEGDS